MHSFQLKLLRKEISRAEQCRRLFEEKLGTSRDEGVKKANDFSKDQKLLAVSFDKGCGFWCYETENILG